MKQLFKTLSISLALLATINTVKAQSALVPQPSSGQTIIQDFGLGKVMLTYSRPNVKGRKIFGNLESYGQVWRTGANSATTLNFTDEVTMAGNKVPAGKYSLFTIPGKEEWTIILNKTADQWGAYDYKKEDDLLRFTIKPVTIKPSVETFAISFTNVMPGSMLLNLVWENTSIVVPITVDYDAKAMVNIEKAMNGEKKPYFAAAQYYYENNKDMKLALEWINEAEKTDVKAPWFKLWKAKILLKMGDKKTAASVAEEGIKFAKESKNAEYVRLLQGLLDQTK